jgi:hypothetical protein
MANKLTSPSLPLLTVPAALGEGSFFALLAFSF